VDPDVRLLRGTPLANRVLDDVAVRARALAGRGIAPTLALVSVGDDPASRIYLARKQAAAERTGVFVRAFAFAPTATPAAVFACLADLAADRLVHGVLLQMPLPGAWPADEMRLAVPVAKDVDGFHPENIGRLAQGLPGFVACTPLGILRLLEDEAVPLAGRRVTIVGRSAIVGTPLALLLSRKGVDATVTLAHSRTPDLPAACREADVLVVAMGVPRAIGREHVRPGAVVVDVGIHREAGHLVGDVRAEEMPGVAAALTPVPGGVGPLTVAFLLANTIEAAERAQPS
jgi:methylenetetrahydrofolate dehydrogenase (NADP+)/methenyltetrahydrofolate cyclohydrolase